MSILALSDMTRGLRFARVAVPPGTAHLYRRHADLTHSRPDRFEAHSSGQATDRTHNLQLPSTADKALESLPRTA